ncbi:MAG TPA: poly(R)-hydroxyalkanoic acid synthase subunit PhaE [Propionibacteriaceae bacterium]|nr:poly(R)-hydroxyalkanoic acid synthase subunit PhaE [Propionibacteriaceae bacterium]
MTTTSWEEMSRRWRELTEAQAEATTRWVDAQSQLVKTLAGAGASADPASDAAAMADMWRSSMALGGILTSSVPGMEGGGLASEMLTRMVNPMSTALVGGSQVGDVIRRMTEGPRLADVGGLERQMVELMDLYVAVQAATRAYETVVASAWTKASQRFAEDISQRAQTGKGLRPGKKALEVWMDIANQTLVETHRSAEFLTAQRDLLRRGMDFLLAERHLFEQLVEPAGLPTRTEIDEVHQSVWELKRRIRELERRDKPRSDGAQNRKRSGRSAGSAGTSTARPSRRNPRLKDRS